MKISLLLPEGSRNARSFALEELAKARNIKNKNERKSVESGLRKISNQITDFTSGIAIFTDGTEILI